MVGVGNAVVAFHVPATGARAIFRNGGFGIGGRDTQVVLSKVTAGARAISRNR